MIKKELILAYFDVAERFSQLSCCNRMKVGAIVVKNGSILAHGWNGTVSNYYTNFCEDEKGNTHPFVVHAEQNLITKMAKSTESMNKSSVFCTHTPCTECAKMLAQVGISEFYYINVYHDNRGLDVLKELNISVYARTDFIKDSQVQKF